MDSPALAMGSAGFGACALPREAACGQVPGPVGPSGDAHGVAVVAGPAGHRGCRHRIAEDACPHAHPHARRRDRRPPPMPPGGGPGGGVGAPPADLRAPRPAQHRRRRARAEARPAPRPAPVGRAFEVPGEAPAADGARRPAVPRGPRAGRHGEMGLPHARAPDGCRVLVPVDEAGRGGVPGPRPRHARPAGPAGVPGRPRAGEARPPCLAADDAPAPGPRPAGGRPGRRLRERPAAVGRHWHEL